MNRLPLLVIFIATVRHSELLQVLYNSDNHPHHLVTFQKIPDSEGHTTYKQISSQKADFRRSNKIYKYDPTNRNIGPILEKLRNPPNSHYPDTTNILTPRQEMRERRTNQVFPIRNRDDRHDSILELFINIFHNIAGTIPLLDRSDPMGSMVREKMGNITKSDWLTVAVVASSIIGYILYLWLGLICVYMYTYFSLILLSISNLDQLLSHFMRNIFIENFPWTQTLIDKRFIKWFVFLVSSDDKITLEIKNWMDS